jgi:uncharacterized protein (TIGR03086 family)
VEELVARHRRACDEFGRVAAAVREDRWTAPTPCAEWDARAVVEHVIGFHEFLLLRPLGVRAQRPRTGPAERWEATSRALFRALADEGVLDRATDLPGGGQSSPRTMLAALTTDVLVHTWDLAVATGVEARLDRALCVIALGQRDPAAAPTSMYAAPVAVPDSTEPCTRLLAASGRDPMWTPPARG